MRQQNETTTCALVAGLIVVLSMLLLPLLCFLLPIVATFLWFFPALALESILPEAALDRGHFIVILSPFGMLIVWGPPVAVLLCWIVYRWRRPAPRLQRSKVLGLWDGGSLPIQQSTYEQGEGCDSRYTMTFAWKGTKYRWAGNHLPIAIQPDEANVYIVVLDRESEQAQATPGSIFRIYRDSDAGSWAEIRPEEFPKHLAIQNTGLRSIHDHTLVAKMDPQDPEFVDSLTARLWAFLENPEDSIGKEPTESLISAYKAKWIRVVNTDQPPLLASSGHTS